MRGTHDYLVVHSDPAGAEVRLSNGEVGETPAEFYLYRRTRVDVTVSKPGYEDAEISVVPLEASGAGFWTLATFLVSLPLIPFNFLIAAADNFSGAVFDLEPNPIDVELQPIGSSWPELPSPTRRLRASSVSCDEPHELARDCSWWSGAEREISVRGIRVRVASTRDGRVLQVEPVASATRPARTTVPRPRKGAGRRRAGKASSARVTPPRRGASGVESCARVHRELALAGLDPGEYTAVIDPFGRTVGCFLRYEGDAYTGLVGTPVGATEGSASAD